MASSPKPTWPRLPALWPPKSARCNEIAGRTLLFGFNRGPGSSTLRVAAPLHHRRGGADEPSQLSNQCGPEGRARRYRVNAEFPGNSRYVRDGNDFVGTSESSGFHISQTAALLKQHVPSLAAKRFASHCIIAIGRHAEPATPRNAADLRGWDTGISTADLTSTSFSQHPTTRTQHRRHLSITSSAPRGRVLSQVHHAPG